jgi:glycerol-3-phosphate acyltransferase PlsY
MPQFVLSVIIMVLLPFLLCGVNSAIVVTKLKSGEDIRKLGSGNAGLTNTLRTQGKWAALFVLLGDLIKGIASILLVDLAFFLLTGAIPFWAPYAAGIFAMLGHVFPVYYGFRGGRGVLVTAAVMYAIDPITVTVLILIFIGVIAATKYVSLASCTAAVLYPCSVLIAGFLRSQPTEQTLITALIAAGIGAMLVFMHRENIKRLIKGTENKLSFKKKGS